MVQRLKVHDQPKLPVLLGGYKEQTVNPGENLFATLSIAPFFNMASHPLVAQSCCWPLAEEKAQDGWWSIEAEG